MNTSNARTGRFIQNWTLLALVAAAAITLILVGAEMAGSVADLMLGG